MFIKYQHVKVGAILLAVVGAIALAVLAFTTIRSGLAELNSEHGEAMRKKLRAAKAERRAESRAESKFKSRAKSKSKSMMRKAMAAADKSAPPNSKNKDALGRGSWKVNLYEETGDDHYDRAKIDRDRDESWDEKWNYKKGRWEKDGGSKIWSDGKWRTAGDTQAGKKASPEPRKSGKGSDTLNAAAKRMLSERATGKKAKDITKGSGPKINLYDDDGDGRWDRAKVDRDRDDNWDEKWTRKGDKLERKADGGVAVFKDGAWPR